MNYPLPKDGGSWFIPLFWFNYMLGILGVILMVVGLVLFVLGLVLRPAKLVILVDGGDLDAALK